MTSVMTMVIAPCDDKDHILAEIVVIKLIKL